MEKILRLSQYSIKLKHLIFLEAIAFASLLGVMTGAMRVATVSYFIMLAGVFVRKSHRSLHIKMMLTAILTDLTLVLVLQTQRLAIQTAISMKLSALQQMHILFSTMATALYVPIMILGYLLIRRPDFYRRFSKWHARIGILTFVFRSLGFLLMFSMLKK